MTTLLSSPVVLNGIKRDHAAVLLQQQLFYAMLYHSMKDKRCIMSVLWYAWAVLMCKIAYPGVCCRQCWCVNVFWFLDMSMYLELGIFWHTLGIPIYHHLFTSRNPSTIQLKKMTRCLHRKFLIIINSFALNQTNSTLMNNPVQRNLFPRIQDLFWKFSVFQKERWCVL